MSPDWTQDGKTAYQFVARLPLSAFQSVPFLSSTPVFVTGLLNGQAFPGGHCNTRALTLRGHGKECGLSCDPMNETKRETISLIILDYYQVTLSNLSSFLIISQSAILQRISF